MTLKHSLVLLLAPILAAGCSSERKPATSATANPYYVKVHYPDNESTSTPLLAGSGEVELRSESAVVVPLPLPKELRFVFSIKQTKNSNLQVFAQAFRGDLVKTVLGEVLSFNSEQSGTTVEVRLESLNLLIAEAPDSISTVLIKFVTPEQKQVVAIEMRTSPRAAVVSDQPIAMSEANSFEMDLQTAATLIRRYEIHNFSNVAVTARLPHEVQGSAFRQIRHTKGIQHSGCSGSIVEELYKSDVSGTFFLMPSGASRDNVVKVASGHLRYFDVSIEPTSKVDVHLYAVIDQLHAKLHEMKPCMIGGTYSIVTGCHNGNCVRSHEEEYDCYWSNRSEQYRCRKRSVCDQYEQRANSPVSVTERIDIVGHGIEIQDFLKDSYLFYKDVPISSPAQSGTFENRVKTQSIISGQVDFSSPTKPEPKECL